MSRSPLTAICSVRGIGVAVSVSTSTLRRELLDALLVGDAEALLFVDDQEAEALEVHVLREQAVGADDDVDLAVLEPARATSSCSLLRLEARERRDRDRVVAHARLEGAEVLLREHRRRAEHGDLLARHARRGTRRGCATSVLPKPTSPQTRRSIGRGVSRSRITSSMARAWSAVSSNGKVASKAR